jgi:DNA (cytosine-5)-methyltransferase 1
MNKLKVFEMFAGYGGAIFALKKAGIEYEVVGYSEIDKAAIKIYELNHPGKKNYGDCSKINIEELPEFDLLTGGFPCQPFSVNTRKNARGKDHKSYNLFKDIIRIVEEKKPKYILLENVRGILGEKSKEVFESIKNDLTSQGYDIKIFEANSRNYGIPQNRERVYFICKFGKWENLELPKEEQLKINIKDILEKNIQRREPSIKRYKLQKKENIEKFGDITRFEAIIKNPVFKRNSNIKYEILDAPSNMVSRQQDRIYSSLYSPCLTATGKDYIFEIDGQFIVLTPKECFRLMGFLNDEINLEGISENKKYKLAGNGWDINLVSKIFVSMFKKSNENINKEINNISIEDEYIKRLELELGTEKLLKIKSDLFDKIRIKI